MPRAEPVPKLPSTAQKLSHLAAFSTSRQTTHPDADTQTTCVRNAVQLGNQYQYFNLITCTDGLFSATHLFYLFNSFDYFLLMAWIYPFLPFWNFRAWWCPPPRPRMWWRRDYEGKGANCFAFPTISPLFVATSFAQTAPCPKFFSKGTQGAFPFWW